MKMMKIYGISIVFIILVLSTGFVLAQPLIPETYVGKTYINGNIAPINTPIIVKCASGYEFKTTVTTNSGGYSIDIVFDYLDTSAVEGAKDGEALTWYLDGKEVTSCNRISPCRDTANSGGVNANFDIAIGNIPATTSVKGIQSTTTVVVENKTGILGGIIQKITNRTEEKKVPISQKTETRGFSWVLVLLALLIIFIILIIIVVIVAFLLLRKGRKKKSSLRR